MINKFLLNLFLMVVYMALAGEVSFLSAVAGFVIGALILTMVGYAEGRGGYLRRVWGLVKFGVYFLYILVKANLQVAREVVTPGFSMRPRILRYPVEGLTPVELTTLASAITLTPGTLSADVNEDGTVLYIHAMYAQDRAAAIAELDQLRRWLLREVFDHEL